MAKKDRFNEEMVYNDIMVNPEVNLDLEKNMITKLIPRDLKVIGKNEDQKKLMRSIKQNDVTICAGAAGTGKTYVVLAYVLNMIRKTTNKYNKIYLAKSVTPLKDESFGFIKGDVDDKIKPVMESYNINLEKMLPKGTLMKLIDDKIIEFKPLAYIRGGSLDNCIIVVDEIQNVSLNNARTIMTRLGQNAKMVFLGDTNQIDLKNVNESSLKPLLNIFNSVDDIGIVEMSNDFENVRNPLINVIEEKFNEYYEQQK